MRNKHENDRPNIVWIFPDEWRHDAFGFAGNPVIHTPNIDDLARRGAVFRSAHCESPVCAPSRASLATGLYPIDHGLRDNMHVRGFGSFPGPDVGTAFQRLQEVGYRTAQVGKTHFFNVLHSPEALQAYGFDEVAEEADKWVLHLMDTPYTRHLRSKGLFEDWKSEQIRSFKTFLGRPNGLIAGPERLEPEDTVDWFIGRHAEDWIRSYDGDAPFFLWVGFVGPHMPYDGPRPFSDQYHLADIPLGPLGLDPFPDNRWGTYLRWLIDHLNCAGYTEDDYRLIGKYYYGEGSLIDAAIGRILAALSDTGRDRETWILFSSDHGELMGDHGLIAKHVFYRSSVLVPQVVVPPRGRELGGSFKGLTQGFDVTATILDLAGAKWNDRSGRSLLPVFEGEDVSREVVFSEIQDFLMVATPRHRLIVHAESLEPQALYDLQVDPDERLDVLPNTSNKEIVAELMSRYVEPFLREGFRG